MSLVALHRAQFDIGSGVRVEIESVVGRGLALKAPIVIPGLLSADEEADAEQLGATGLLPMCWRDAGELFEQFQLREDTDYFVDVTVPLPISDASQRASVHPA